jgi:hypothetical protein
MNKISKTVFTIRPDIVLLFMFSSLILVLWLFLTVFRSSQLNAQTILTLLGQSGIDFKVDLVNNLNQRDEFLYGFLLSLPKYRFFFDYFQEINIKISSFVFLLDD